MISPRILGEITPGTTPGFDPIFEHYPWNPVFDPRPRTPDLGYMLRYGVVPVVNITGILVQHPILPPWIWAHPPEQVYMSTDEIRRAQREQHARARCARPRARIMRAHVEVVRRGAQLDEPLLRGTYSCMRGRPVHCGTCLQCRSRRAAFAAAGVRDVEYEAG